MANKGNLFGHNFGVVYRFEVTRMLKKKSFWLSMLAFPLMFAIIFGVSYISNQASNDAKDNLGEQSFSIVITDDSGLIDHKLATQLGANFTDKPDQAIEQVKNNQLDAYFHYPADLANDKIQIYAQDDGLFNSGKYSSTAKALLSNSIQTSVDLNTVAVLSSNISSDSIYYRDGEVYNQLGDMVIPMAFLVLFFLIICIFSNQMLVATVEEKENRITEMILTTISSRTLITGKIFAFVTLILIQALVIIGLIVGGYLLATDSIELPGLDLSFITIDPVRIAISAAIFVISILLFSGLLIAIGAAVPTAKEANQFISIPILLMFMPLYFSTMVISTPEAPIVTAMVFFPFTAPILLMFMNAVGAISILNAVISIVIMAITTIITFIIASHIFQAGAVNYSQRIKLFNARTRTTS